jgi:Fibronectin type III domain/Viral BACON domain
MCELKRHFRFPAWTLRNALLCTAVVLAISLSALPDAWALQVSPTTLSFQAVQGGTTPPSQIVNVLKNNKRTLSWSSSDNATWVSVSPTTGSITDSAQISVSVNPAGLTPGTYTATVTVSVTKGGNISVPVTLTVTSSGTTTSTSSSSNTASLSWNPPTSTSLAGYKVYVGTSSGVYGSSINVGNVTSYAVSNLGVGTTYYFAVTAYNTSGVESGFSNEVSKSIY